jgi:hypothetical protein
MKQKRDDYILMKILIELLFLSFFHRPMTTSNRRSFAYNCSTFVDRQIASKRQLQVIVKKDTKKETGWKEKVKGEGAEDVCDKADTDAKSYASSCLHQSQERRKSRRKASSEIPMAVKSASGL